MKNYKSKIFFICLILLLSFFFVLFLKEARLAKEKEKKVVLERKEIERLKEENKRLAGKAKEELDFLKEREVRLRLGLGEPGERVVIILKRGEAEAKKVELKKKVSNPARWWQHFFKGLRTE